VTVSGRVLLFITTHLVVTVSPDCAWLLCVLIIWHAFLPSQGLGEKHTLGHLRFTPLTCFSTDQVDTILDKENFTLEELLDEDEIIQECKALNTRLINL
jgi:hypothetical protein